MKVAIFSNGFKDVYKGARDVRAGWMVARVETGSMVASGHSLSREHAEKTARGSIPAPWVMPAGWRRDHRMAKRAHDLGYGSPEEMAADYKKKNAEIAKLFRIEVVELTQC